LLHFDGEWLPAAVKLLLKRTASRASIVLCKLRYIQKRDS
jgi:hypothetical protein